jgi:cellulose synthase (UDP-forming)
MLSPQDLLAVTIQRFKYAGGTLDIAFHDNPLFRRGLSLPQRLLYGNTMWSYLATLWNVVFLLSPVVFLFTGIAPVSAYSFDFYKHCVPFLIANNMALMVGTWGLPTWHGQALFLSTFPVNMRAFFTVLRGKKISFPVTPKMRQEGVQLQLVRWQILLILLTALGIVWYGTLIVTGHASKISAWFANSLWGLNNSAALSGIVRAAFWKPDEQGISPGDEGAGMTGDQQAWPVSA